MYICNKIKCHNYLSLYLNELYFAIKHNLYHVLMSLKKDTVSARNKPHLNLFHCERLMWLLFHHLKSYIKKRELKDILP